MKQLRTSIHIFLTCIIGMIIEYELKVDSDVTLNIDYQHPDLHLNADIL